MFRKLLLTLFLLQLVTTSVFSQIPSPVPEQPDEVTLDRLKNDYFHQFELFDQIEEKFEFEKAEYYSVGTLAAKEDAISQMKNLMSARASTLKVYLFIVRKQLVDQPGINPTRRQNAINQIDYAVGYLTTHEQEISPVFDLENINDISKQFESNRNIIFDSLYQSLSLIEIAKLDLLHQELTSLSNEFQLEFVNYIENQSTKEAFQRGMRQIDDRIQSALDLIENSKAKQLAFEELEKSDKFDSAGVYNSINTTLRNTKDEMRTAYRFLSELEKSL